MMLNDQPCEHTNLLVDVSADELIALFSSVRVQLTAEMIWHITVASAALQIAFSQRREGSC